MKSERDDPALAARLDAVLPLLRADLQIDETTEWRVVKVWSKRKKMLFEVEELNQQQHRTLVGRMVRADRNRACFQALEALWAGGLRPPSTFTVPQPIGHLSNWEVILQEKAPGDLLDHLLARDAGTAGRSAVMAGEWLNALHSLPLEMSAHVSMLPRLDLWVAAVRELSPQHARTLERIHSRISMQLADTPDRMLVPSHGDFHATNIFISETGRVTGIDFDNFGGRERAADLGYFLGQTAARGFRKTGSFSSTADSRAAFIQGYATAAHGGMPPHVRIGSFIGATFLRLLHDDLYLMKSGRTDLIPPWLEAAERAAFGIDLE